MSELTPEEKHLFARTLIAFKNFWMAEDPGEERQCVEAFVNLVSELGNKMAQGGADHP